MKYIALLRGINVGGNAIIKMAELKACVAELGHANVRTYIASGNVLFESPERSGAKLDDALGHAIERTFGFPVPVVVRSRAEIERIASCIPEPWIADDDVRVSVAYLLRGADARAIAKGLKPKPGIDRLVTAPGALIWSIRRDALTRTGLKVIGTPAYKQMTIRNATTALKLASLVGTDT